MNKYFTKEYIEECKAEEIQIIRRQIRYEEGLSYQKFYKGDYRYYEDAPQKDNIVLVTKDELWQVNVHYWLPTGDQLDEEIVRICKKNNIDYSFFFTCVEDLKIEYIYEAGIEMNIIYSAKFDHITFCESDNPLIAKIKLLKELLKESEEK